MKKNFLKKFLGIFLVAALLISYLPPSVLAAQTPPAESAITGTVTDPNTAASWETMMGTAMDGNRYAGRVWVDRSVYGNGDTVVLNSKGNAGSSFQVALKDDEAFQVVFSALGSSMQIKSTVSSTGPMDVVLILDNSVSMNTVSGGTTRMQKVIEAANKLLADLLDGNDVRLGIAAYSEDASVVLPFGTYNDGVVLKVNSYTGTGSRNGVITAYNSDNQVINRNYKSAGYANYTNTQSGFDMGMEMLANATNTANRKPVVILLTDGAANTAVDTLFDADRTGTVRQVYYSNNIDPMIALSTLLSAAYNKAAVEDHYGKSPMIYGIGVDLSNSDGSNAIINPKDNFNSRNSNANIRAAYTHYTDTWAAGKNISVTSGTGSGFGSSQYTFRFGHEYPQGSGITDRDVINNIHYVDTYYPVTGADLQGAFDQIYEELSSGVFNPISTSTSVSGGTGVDNTPLIYVDFIGQHMEIKEMQSVSLFGASYGIIENADGTYTVDLATGTNPTTSERWNTSEDILITVTEQTDGTQKLEVRINQEILPIIMEQIVSETVGNQTSATITEFMQEPLRLYYTIGVDSDILLPNGEVDVSKIQGYAYIDDANGTVSFYGTKFGEMNPADASGNVIKGDAHVGFKPSAANRYYYHQTNQGIFTKITNKSDGSTVTIPENNEYGIVWDEAKYDLTWMTYAEYQAVQDSDTVYNYVTYYRPTPSTTDAATAAEEVTYLVYTEWRYVKESITFYDDNTGTYLNDGKAIPVDEVEATIAAYMQSNPDAELYAVLGVGSHRTSRLHNMTVDKESNRTDTAEERYTPEYTYDTATLHNGNDVVVWLGNNGKLTMEIDTGIALTKAVTEAIGNPDDTYALTVTVPAGVTATPVVVDANGASVASTYRNNVLTIPVKAGQTVYVSGIPGGTQCLIDEVVNGDYRIDSKTDSVTIPMVSQALNGTPQFVSAVVTNAPHKYGSLFITKEITSEHTVPGSVMNAAFEITVNLGAALANKTFQVLDSEHTAAYDKTADSAGNMTFRIQANQTIEIQRLPAGTPVTVTETTPGSHFAVSYRTRNNTGENADSDNALVIPADGGATAVVLNHYTPASVSVDLDIAGTKNFTAEGAHNGGRFVYKVQKWNGTTWEDIPGKTAETPYDANTDGIKTFRIEDVLAGITYTKVGSHAYQVIEVKGDVANVTYDRTLYTFNVTVTDNGGQLVAAVTDLNNNPVTDGSYEVTFNNTYNTAPVSLDVQKIVDNKSGDTTVSKAGFAFTAVRTDANWAPLTGTDASSITIYTDAAGEARFSSVCTIAGVYHFVLTEVNQNAPGWTYSGAEYRITVTVTENNGELTAALDVVKANSQNVRETATVDAADATKGAVTFVNTYDPTDATVNLDGKVMKDLTGKTLNANMFTFYVLENDKGAVRDYENALLQGVNGLAGDVTKVDFTGALTFDKVGKYEYDIVEYIPEGAVYDAASGKYLLNGMRYDPTIYDLVVEVTNDSATGKLVASYYFEDAVGDTVTYRNSYAATPTQYTLGGAKVLHGRAPRDGEFTFELHEAGALKQAVTNRANGSFTFAAITYTEAGTYTYTIKEAPGNAAGVRYDGVNNPVTVTVTVTDTNGVLSASASIRNADIKFENTYTASPAQVTFNGVKTLVGDTLTDNSFTFKFYQTDTSFDITKSSAQLLDTKQNADGAFTFAKAFATTGTYYFTIVEDAAVNPVDEVVYDRTQHRFEVKVTDDGNGQLNAVVTNFNTNTSSASGAAVSTNFVFTNATFDEATEKEVYKDGNTTQIDGEKVDAGDVLTYFITYTNYTGENVVVDIMDTIPNHTSYVEGTASHNGTYAGGHLNWILNVAKGESVTVTFDVKVNETDAIVANTAVVRDGVNTYHTNEVVTHTVETVLKKDVFSSADDAASIDGNKVSRNDELLYKISFTNASRDAVDIRITDRIPANTTYVAGSADNGGVYADGVIVWTLEDVPAWTTVTVTFKVTVNSDVGAVTIENKATATDGVNNYETEVVTNYTEEVVTPPTEPPVTPPTEVPDNPKTGDNAKLLLMRLLLLASFSGLVVTSICGKKRKATEEI